MKAWTALSLLLILAACGGTFTDQASHKSPNVDGGDTGGSPGNGGGVSAGGRGAGGLSGPGGAIAAGGLVAAGGGIIIPMGGTPGAGGLDCSNVGCGQAPVCGQPCGAPCGCCGCPDGQHQQIGGIDHTCTGGCWSP